LSRRCLTVTIASEQYFGIHDIIAGREDSGRTRVAVIGNAGAPLAGANSTMARKLDAAQGLSYFAIDHLQYCSGWQPTPKDEARHGRTSAAWACAA
jgi:hypothetical protein